MFSFQFVSYPSTFTLDESRIAEIFSLVGEEVDITQNGILNIAFLSDSEIQELNKTYRGKDKSTDVLSFHYFDDFAPVSDDEIAGEIILSESHILAQAKEYHHTPREECEILIIHSILHILGFDHETDEEYEEMWGYEEKLREKLAFSKISL